MWNRSRALVVVAMIVVGVVAWILLTRSRGDEHPATLGVDSANAPTPVSSPAPLTAPDAERSAEPVAATRKSPASQPMSAITGVVRDPLGRPIAGVAVAIRAGEANGDEARSNATGAFSIAPILPGGAHTLSFRERSHVSRVLESVPAGARLDVVMCDGVPIHGQVVEDATGAPIAGARLSFGGDGEWLRSDSDGRFATGADPSGAFATCEKPGFVHWTGAPFQPTPDLEVVIRLKREEAHSVAYLFVTDAVNGRPVENLHAEPGPLTDLGGGLVSVGTIEFARARGGRIEAPGYAARAFDLRDDEARNPSTALPIALAHGVAIHGKIVDANARPVAGAQVGAAPKSGGTFLDTTFPAFRAITGEDGTFRFTDLPPRAETQLWFHDDRFRERPMGVITTPETGDLAVDPIVVEPARRLRGVVRDDATGEAIPAAKISLRTADLKSHQTTSDGRGAFDVAMFDEPAVLFASAPGLIPTSIESIPTTSAEPVEIRMRPGASIAGVVVDSTGAPVIGASVDVIDWSPSARPDLSRFRGAARGDAPASSDSTGAFRLTGLLPGKFTLDASRAPGEHLRPSPPIEVASDVTGVRLELVCSAKVAGRVTDARTGEPIVAFTVTKEYENGASAETVTDSDGRFILDVDPDRAVTVSTMSDGFAPLAATDLRVASGEIRQLAFPLQPESSLEGLLQDAAGRPLQGEIQLENPTSRFARITPIIAGRDGRFRLAQLPAGTTRLSATARFDLGDGASVTQPVALAPASVDLAVGQVLTQTFVATPLGDAKLALDLVIPSEMAGSAVRIQLDGPVAPAPATSGSTNLTTSRSGRVVLGPLAAGEYQVSATYTRTNDGRTVMNLKTGVTRVTLTANAETPVRLELPVALKKSKP